MHKPKAPFGCFWRGGVLWGRMRRNGTLIRWSLHTADPKVATERRNDRRPADGAGIKRKLTRMRLSRSERLFLFDAVDAAVLRQRAGAKQ